MKKFIICIFCIITVYVGQNIELQQGCRGMRCSSYDTSIQYSGMPSKNIFAVSFWRYGYKPIMYYPANINSITFDDLTLEIIEVTPEYIKFKK